MIILKIEDKKGYFYSRKNNAYHEINSINKEYLNELISLIIDDDVEVMKYEENCIVNKAQDIIYKSLSEKFDEIIKDKNSIKQRLESKYKDAINKYA